MSENFIHASACVDDGAVIGAGCKIWHFCHVMPGAVLGDEVVLGQNGFVGPGVRIGDRCRIQNNVSLYDGVVLEDAVFVGPSVVFTNVKRPRADFPRKDRFDPTRVGEGASLGANATIICGVKIGSCAMIGAGAVVTADVPPYALMLGAPARQAGWVCRCGEPLVVADETARCAACDRQYRLESDGLLEVGHE